MRGLALAVMLAGVASGACAASPPDRSSRDALLWDAARECEKRFSSTVRVKEIDHLGRLSVEWRATAADTEPFFACYREQAQARGIDLRRN